MILDKILFDNLPSYSEHICDVYKVKKPNNYKSLCQFINALDLGINDGDIISMFVGLILHNFVSSKEIRDRKVTASVFEDVFGALIGSEPNDKKSKGNPPVSSNIFKYDSYCDGLDWKVSSDLSSNKRQKADHSINNYHLSLKTLKGDLYDINGKIINKKKNEELNIGSLSFRALFIGLTNINKLKDRKGGLGSSKQIKPLLRSIKARKLFNEFKHRIKDYMKYVYKEDILIVYKSGYRMTFYLIPNSSFLKAIEKSLNSNKPIDDFTKIWYRWENNNLRLSIPNMFNAMQEYKLKFFSKQLDFSSIYHNSDFMNMYENLKSSIKTEIEELSDSLPK